VKLHVKKYEKPNLPEAYTVTSIVQNCLMKFKENLIIWDDYFEIWLW